MHGGVQRRARGRRSALREAGWRRHAHTESPSRQECHPSVERRRGAPQSAAETLLVRRVLKWGPCSLQTQDAIRWQKTCQLICCVVLRRGQRNGRGRGLEDTQGCLPGTAGPTAGAVVGLLRQRQTQPCRVVSDNLLAATCWMGSPRGRLGTYWVKSARNLGVGLSEPSSAGSTSIHR